MIKPIAATVSLSHAYDRQCQCPSCTARERLWTKMKDTPILRENNSRLKMGSVKDLGEMLDVFG